jgi:hypothetical protein
MSVGRCCSTWLTAGPGLRDNIPIFFILGFNWISTFFKLSVINRTFPKKKRGFNRSLDLEREISERLRDRQTDRKGQSLPLSIANPSPPRSSCFFIFPFHSSILQRSPYQVPNLGFYVVNLLCFLSYWKGNFVISSSVFSCDRSGIMNSIILFGLDLLRVLIHDRTMFFF